MVHHLRARARQELPLQPMPETTMAMLRICYSIHANVIQNDVLDERPVQGLGHPRREPRGHELHLLGFLLAKIHPLLYLFFGESVVLGRLRRQRRRWDQLQPNGQNGDHHGRGLFVIAL